MIRRGAIVRSEMESFFIKEFIKYDFSVGRLKLSIYYSDFKHVYSTFTVGLRSGRNLGKYREGAKAFIIKTVATSRIRKYNCTK